MHRSVCRKWHTTDRAREFNDGRRQETQPSCRARAKRPLQKTHIDAGYNQRLSHVVPASITLRRSASKGNCRSPAGNFEGKRRKGRQNHVLRRRLQRQTRGYSSQFAIPAQREDGIITAVVARYEPRIACRLFSFQGHPAICVATADTDVADLQLRLTHSLYCSRHILL